MSKKTEDSLLKKAAKAVGEAAGAVVHAVTPHEPTPKKKKVGKLPPKNKSRLPRKEKKAMNKRKKAAA